MRSFVLWFAVVIGCLLGLLLGDADMRGAVLCLAAFLAIGTAAYLVDGLKKAPRRSTATQCLDCRAGHHYGCCTDSECEKVIRNARVPR